MDLYIRIKKIHPIGICTADTNIVDQRLNYDDYVDILSKVLEIIHDPISESWIATDIAISKLKNIYGDNVDILIEEPDLIPCWGEIKFPFINTEFN